MYRAWVRFRNIYSKRFSNKNDNDNKTKTERFSLILEVINPRNEGKIEN